MVIVYFKGRSAELAFTLVNVKQTEMYGKKMLSGVHADTGQDSDWRTGREARIAFDAVESLTYYEGIDDYKKAIAEFSDETL